MRLRARGWVKNDGRSSAHGQWAFRGQGTAMTNHDLQLILGREKRSGDSIFQLSVWERAETEGSKGVNTRRPLPSFEHCVKNFTSITLFFTMALSDSSLSPSKKE